MNRIIEKVHHYSSLISRSPSCTCIIEDIVDDIVQTWNLLFGAIIINQQNNGLNIISSSKSSLANNYINYLENSKEIQLLINFKKSDWDNSYTYHTVQLDGQSSSLVILPMWIDDHIFGAICLFERTPDVISKEETHLLQIITNQLGMAIEKEVIANNYQYLEYCFYSILESLTEGIVLANEESIQYVNKAAQQLLNVQNASFPLSKEIFIEYVLSNIKHEVEMEMYFEMADKVPSYYFICETNNHRYLRISKFQIRNDYYVDNEWGFHISDITTQVKSEKLKDNLLATVSHDLRTPLTSIKGNVSSLMRKDVSWDKETKNQFLQDIYEESDRLNQMIEKLLNQSKIQAGVLTLDKSTLSLFQLKNKIQKKIEACYADALSYIDFHMKNENDVVYIDYQKILQVIFNLVENAVKYQRENLKINIHLELKDESFFASIQDNGIGISKDDLAQIFNRYYRADGTKPVSGIGLGLYICKGFVEAHEGKIWAESKQGEGSTFHILIPNEVSVV